MVLCFFFGFCVCVFFGRFWSGSLALLLFVLLLVILGIRFLGDFSNLFGRFWDDCFWGLCQPSRPPSEGTGSRVGSPFMFRASPNIADPKEV